MRHKTWFKTFQDRLLSDPAYLALSPAARGVIADLRCFASRTADHGRTGHTAKSFLRWCAGNRDAAETALKSLLTSGFVTTETATVRQPNGDRSATEPDSEILRIPNWDESQETPKAALMRRLREQGRHGAGGNKAVTVPVTVTPQTEAEAESPNPLPEIPVEIEQLAFRVFGHTPLANLGDWIGLHGGEKVRAALLETEKNGARSPAYTEKILQSWARNGTSKGNSGNGRPTPEKLKLYDPQNAFAD